MIQYLIIAAIVLWAVLYSVWNLMPAGARRALAQRAGAWARHAGVGEKQAQELQDRLAQPASCSACSTCSGCSKPSASAARSDNGEPRPH